MLPYLWLSLAIVWLWLPPQSSAGRPISRVAVSAGWLLLGIGHAAIASVVSATGALAILIFGALCYAAFRSPAGWLRSVAMTATVLFSLGLMAHVIPGFSNVLVVRDAVLSPGAVPYTLYLNFDKAQVGLFLLAFGPPLITSRTGWMTLLRVSLPWMLLLIAALMVCALALGQVRLDLKWPQVFPVWAWANLLFTCAAEEALFRGVIQRRLQGESETGVSARSVGGLVIAATIFGVAHYAGGILSIVLATIAGLGYGWIFWRTSRIEASILAHFLVNTTHILCFTYPALA